MRHTLFAALVILVAGCTSTAPAAQNTTPTAAASAQRFPDVTGVAVRAASGGPSFDVTVSSPYDTPTRYADAIRIRNADGTVYGVRDLDHDHAGEQPFTRSVTDVTIPAGVVEVVAEARDLVNGWGGGTQTVPLRP